MSYDQLRKSIIQNDANDNNIVVSNDLDKPKVIAIIDFGDAIFTQTINDISISLAYVLMHQSDPLEVALPIINAYHNIYPLSDEELKHIYNLVGMRLIVSITQAIINSKKDPTNQYYTLSKEPARQLLAKWYKIDPEFASSRFSSVCA